MKSKNAYQKVTSYEARVGEVKKVLLLYSGGLDSSIAIKWIQDKYGAEVITFTANLGQREDFATLREKALRLGAKKAHLVDLRMEFADNYISQIIKGNGLYQGKYPLSTAISRYIMIDHAIRIAHKEGVGAIAHGSTGKGNSQLRFDTSITTLDPGMKVIAPIREWGITRDKEIEYAHQHNIPVPAVTNSPYSFDENIWGRGIASGPLEDPSKEPPDDIYSWIAVGVAVSSKPIYIELDFERGLPIKLNGKRMSLYKMVEKLNHVAGTCGVGIIDHVEDRIIGLKSRDIYECPAAIVILEAHKDLEKFVSTSHVNNFKHIVDEKFSWLTYAGLWYDPLTDALRAFIDKANQYVTGHVRLRLQNGSVRIVGRSSPFALYDKQMTTYMSGQTFNHLGAAGFVELFGLQTKMARAIHQKKKRK